MRRRSGSTSAHVLSSGSVAGGPLVTPFRIQKGTMFGRSIGLVITGALSFLCGGLALRFPTVGSLLVLLLPVFIAYMLITEPMWIEFGDRLTYRDFYNVHVEDWPNVKLAVQPLACDDSDSSLCGGHRLFICLPNGVTITRSINEWRQILRHFDAEFERAAHKEERGAESLVNLREWLVNLRECLLEADPPENAEHGVAPNNGGNLISPLPDTNR
jgi:hypothetical protein